MRIAILLVLLVITLYFVTRYIEKNSIFFPYKMIEMTPQDQGLAYEDITIETRDKLKLNGWYVKSSTPTGRACLILHGNGGNISHPLRIEKMGVLSRMGLDVFIIDYRGYGRSEGDPSEKGIYMDAEAAFDYLVEERGFEAESVIVFGESLGSAVAAHLVSARPAGAIITMSAFSSIKDMARHMYPLLPTFFVRTRLDTLAGLRKTSIPKLIMHSQDDDIVPFKMGERLYAEALEPKRFVTLGGEHNAAFFDNLEVTRNAIQDFIRSLDS